MRRECTVVEVVVKEHVLRLECTVVEVVAKEHVLQLHAGVRRRSFSHPHHLLMKYGVATI